MEEVKTVEELAEVSETEEAIKRREIERAEKLAALTKEIFEERREAFLELAKGPSPNESSIESRMDAAADSLMDRRSKLFEKLAEGAK
ncbi:MAG: hypothetical protein AAB401_03730 [Acidobacteriota bacterium]